MADSSPASSASIDYVVKAALFVLGGLTQRLWTNFGNRIRRLTWTARHTPIAMASNNPSLGTVTVQHDGVNVNHLHATTVELVNESNQDVKDILLTLSFQGVGHVIDTRAGIDNTSLVLDPAYLVRLANANAAQAELLNSAIEYRIPVLNRRKRAVFHMLVRRDDLSPPFVLASCNHPGFRLDPMKVPPIVIWGVGRDLAVIVGLMITIPVMAFLLWRFHHPYTDPVIAFIFGLAVAAVGAVAVKSFRLLARIFA
jgi:hypothetical protein